jgi:hypothetical protein
MGHYGEDLGSTSYTRAYLGPPRAYLHINPLKKSDKSLRKEVPCDEYFGWSSLGSKMILLNLNRMDNPMKIF